MKKFKGITASPGIVIGKAFLCTEVKLAIPRYDIRRTKIDKEFLRFQSAVGRISEDLNHSIEEARREERDLDRRLLESHLMMINDPDFSFKIHSGLKKELKNVECVIVQVIEDMTGKLSVLKDEYLRERSYDFHDISRRIINQLLNRSRQSIANVSDEVVLVAHNLMPSDTISLNKAKVLGIATDVGGKTSHTAILARSLEIPAVLGLSHITWNVNDGDELIIDGNSGTVIVNPDENVKEQYQRKKQKWDLYERNLHDLDNLPAKTLDNKIILLEANIEIPEEIESVHGHGADGIGLYRSEFLFIQPHTYPPEETQYIAYRHVLEGMKGKSVVIRTLDLGGDKIIPGFKDMTEDNPILGWRAVRFCLSNPDIFKTQIRALYRAAVHGNLKIMFPMISGPEELDKILALVAEVRKDLRKEGLPYKEDVPLGIMIEIPSAALTSDVLARKVDFFSIGTNDLIQYTIAVDRGNERIAYLYEPLHLGVLRTIKIVIDNAHQNRIPVSMCGEMAADPMLTVVLLGLGLDGFSMSAASVPEIKRIIRSVDINDARRLTEKVLKLSCAEEIHGFLKSWMEDRFDIFGHKD